MWNMVEGSLDAGPMLRMGAAPSVTPPARHLPVPGRI